MKSPIRTALLMFLFVCITGVHSVFAFPEMAQKKSGGELAPLSSSGMAGGIMFQAPDMWKPAQPSSSMRLYQFEVPAPKEGGKNAELAVFHFPGTGGDVAGNIERWKTQFSKLSDGFTPEQKKEAINGIQVTSVYIEGTLGSGMPGMPTEAQTNYAILGAVAEGPQGLVFYKMMGPKETVQSSRGDFVKLLQSFKTHP